MLYQRKPHTGVSNCFLRILEYVRNCVKGVSVASQGMTFWDFWRRIYNLQLSPPNLCLVFIPGQCCQAESNQRGNHRMWCFTQAQITSALRWHISLGVTSTGGWHLGVVVTQERGWGKPFGQINGLVEPKPLGAPTLHAFFKEAAKWVNCSIHEKPH